MKWWHTHTHKCAWNIEKKWNKYNKEKGKACPFENKTKQYVLVICLKLKYTMKIVAKNVLTFFVFQFKRSQWVKAAQHTGCKAILCCALHAAFFFIFPYGNFSTLNSQLTNSFKSAMYFVILLSLHKIQKMMEKSWPFLINLWKKWRIHIFLTV